MRLSAYGAVNILLAALWVVFIPSYWMLVHCPTCPDFLKAAGELVELLWHPSTHRLKLKYGAGGNVRYAPDTGKGVLRPACVPCPVELYNDQIVGFSGNNQTSGVSSAEYKVLPDELKLCVRVEGLNLPGGRVTSVGGGASMDARTYLHFQLFGPNYEKVLAKIYANAYTDPNTGKPQRRTLEFTTMRKHIQQYERDIGPIHNTSLFKKRSPWPFVNTTVTATATEHPTYKTPMDTPDTVSYGFYLLNGRPFVPPKLWDYRLYDPVRGDSYAGDGGKYSITSNMGKKPPGANYSLSDKMMQQSSGGSKHPIVLASAEKETEWWYSGLCPSDKCGSDWYTKTSLQYWGDEHYRDYIQRFFAGGSTISCVWVPQ